MSDKLNGEDEVQSRQTSWPDVSVSNSRPRAVGDEAGEERWVFAGLRVVRGQAVQAWITESGGGQVLYFAPRGTPVVGEIYRVRVTREGDKVILHDQPLYLGDGRVAEDDAARLLAEHEVARTHLAAVRLERAAAGRDELDVALQPLKKIAAGLRRRTDKEAFIAHVIHELISPRDLA